MIYEYLGAAERMACEVYDSLYRSNGIAKTLKFQFWLDYSVYDENGDDTGDRFYWQVIYHGRGGRYIKVLWNTIQYRPEYKESDWEEIADHDSCWRGSWGHILQEAREFFKELEKKKGSWYFTLDHVEEIDEKEYQRIDSKLKDRS
jgi:hypothetical protein